ncbi:hypothetical protein SAMN05192566_0736 [Methylophilus rhizosphaerae]|uniref:Uncharacterized protein n=1 Tax=Methylophilus rhizosphaerae TaxID=492660 RepID=A0A1G9A7Y6_9PROT|nr:hypothetical protein [Methylophilus rhizosphaerae]SDK23408.1 hypothetical protein SAMN05192566_0736 [Methylophilus rhizosphaerae]
MNKIEKVYSFNISKNAQSKDIYNENELLFSSRDVDQQEKYYLNQLNVVSEKLHNAYLIIDNNNKTIRNLATVLVLVLGCVSILAWRLYL